MVRVLGTSKVDDFNRVVLEDSVMNALNIAPGDSVLLYKRLNERGLGLYKSEGAVATSECDSPKRDHLVEFPVEFRVFQSICAIFLSVALVLCAVGVDDLADPVFICAFIVWIIGVALIGASVALSSQIDKKYENQRFETVGNPYGKDRIAGISSLSGDGYVHTGQVYINSLFGSNPASVDITLELQDGRSLPILSVCTKDVPGYSVYTFRFKEENLCDGTFMVKIVFHYHSKSITLDAAFRMSIDAYGKATITEGPVTAVMTFDKQLDEVDRESTA
jgi:hypothetical protein